tara:strand:+ start:830 stop:1129 length:300 start_codon:yes stop_codon:yes gene_type:complete
MTEDTRHAKKIGEEPFRAELLRLTGRGSAEHEFGRARILRDASAADPRKILFAFQRDGEEGEVLFDWDLMDPACGHGGQGSCTISCAQGIILVRELALD